MSPNDLTQRLALGYSRNNTERLILYNIQVLLGGSMMKKLFSATLMLGALASCQPTEPPLDILGPVPELGHGLMEGYLHGEPPLNSAAFVPAPPTEGTARQQAMMPRVKHCGASKGLLAGIRLRGMPTFTSLPRHQYSPVHWAPPSASLRHLPYIAFYSGH